MRKIVLLLAATTGLGLGLSGCATPLVGGDRARTPAGDRVSAAATFALLGDLTVRPAVRPGTVDAHACAMPSGRADIQTGAQVTVIDGEGATIALGQLWAPTYHRETGLCSFPISIAGVPRGRGHYGVVVSHSGAVRFAEADVVADPVHLTLGS